MSIEQQEQLTHSLCKLGMSVYQARVFSSLASLGPSGVAEIQRSSGVPRTKIYEILEQLVGMGAVEFQSGRPVIYNALSPEILVDRMRKSYLNAADEATRLLAEMHQTGRNTNEDLVWTVKGNVAIRRKASLTIASAKTSILIVEPYPPEVSPANSSIIKSQQKKVKTRSVCILQPGQHFDENLKNEDFIEFRRVANKIPPDSDKFFKELRSPMISIMSKASCLIIIDDVEAFVGFPNKSDDSKSLGLTLRVPGLPYMQRLLFERVWQQSTIKIRR
ncbi:MAG: helix-turn-helix domain-containing protein [Candidatus Bathyarchaeia archaeon]|jgi:sugar-specific transcriptional regulator TrmB